MDLSHPFLLTCCTRGPHSPFVVPAEYYDMYDPNAIPEPRNFGPGDDEPEFLENSYYRQMWREWGTTWSAWRKSVAVYWGYVAYLDSLFGQVIDRLKRSGIYDRTLVIMTADHGEMLGQHGLGHKFCPYEENLRIPLAMRLPGVIRPRSRITMDVSQIDVAPTILSVADLPLDPAWEGENLLRYINQERPIPASRDVFAQYNLGPDWGFHKVHNWRLIVRRPWKYIYHESYGPEMYNLEADPWETRNLARAEHLRDVRAELHHALFDWMARTKDPLLASMEVPLS
jgi:arylsulfatase A-like enzyme